jgi:N-sulfoglucosamine sulfohydrolase
MNRKKLLLITLLGLLTCSFCAPVEARAKGANFLLVTVDDMNWDSVGAFGCRVPDITPNIDRLASQGMRFQHAHVTIAICQPTRAVWMTGRYPHRNGALGFDPINRGVPTLLETLKDAGYFTGILAKVPHVVPTRGKAWDVVVQAGELKVGRDPKLYYERSREIIRQAAAAKKPFFLMANSQDPHRPFAGSAQEQGRKKNQIKNKPNRFPGVSRTYKPDEVTVPRFLPDLPAVRKEIAQYYTSVHRADEITGAVLRALDESGAADNTLVMFLSDHGMPLPFAKTNCWYHSTRTPWIVRWPGKVKAGAHDQTHFISGIDLAPTVLDALGLQSLDGADGRSFLPVLRGETQEGRDHVFTHINRTAGRNEYPMRAVQTAKFGYIFNGWSDGKKRFKNESQNGLTMKAMIRAAETNEKLAARVKHFLYRTPEELYDYENDPDALNNLAADPKYKQELARLRKTLYKHMQATGDPQLVTIKSGGGAR